MGSVEGTPAENQEPWCPFKDAQDTGATQGTPCTVMEHPSSGSGELSTVREHVHDLLQRHGLPLEQYGVAGALSEVDLAREVQEGISELEVDEAGSLVRRVSVVQVSVIASLPGSNFLLTEDEQILDDGRRRARPGRLHVKLRQGEEPQSAIRRILPLKLGLHPRAAAAAAALVTSGRKASNACEHSGGTGEAVCTSEPEQKLEVISSSYPGLRTHCSLYRAELHIPTSICGADGSDSAKQELLSQLGLPSAKPFVSVEGTLGSGNGGCVHVWHWSPTEDRTRLRQDSLIGSSLGCHDLDSHDDDEDELTGLEQAHRDLLSVQRIIDAHKATLHERGGMLEMQLQVAQERLTSVIKRISNVEALVHVDVDHLFTSRSPTAARLSKDLRLFISSNFADGSAKKNFRDRNRSNTVNGPTVRRRQSRSSSPTGRDKISPRKRVTINLPSSEANNIKLPPLDLMNSKETGDTDFPLLDMISPKDRRESVEMAAIIAGQVEHLRNEGADQRYVLNMLEISDKSGRRALLTMAELIVVPHAAELETTEKTMRRYASALHRRYGKHANPFHNEAHAAIVCHATHWFGVRGGAWAGTPMLERLATDIAALAHDVGHFGRNNAFCTNSGHELALIYNDKSILENMHAATAFQLMQEDGCNILSACSRENRRQFREHVVDLILATDMTSHFEFLGKFRVRAQCSEFCPQVNMEDRRLVMRCYLKAADLGHAALPWEMHEKWALLLLKEFYDQGDEERQRGLPVSPMCERSGNVGEFRESQNGFLQFVILPLFKELATVALPEVGKICISRIEENAEEWVNGEPSNALVSIVQERPKTKAPAVGAAESPVKAAD